VRKYAEENNLSSHPLFSKGYRSIGCASCTIVIGLNDDERAGRGKIECWLHIEMIKHKEIAQVKQDFELDPLVE
jgi:phosphoadenosine phosphosulfate reductase